MALTSVPTSIPLTRSDSTLAKLRIKSIKDLSKWKFARWAEALSAAAEFENDEQGSR